jgi:hypothetical protein
VSRRFTKGDLANRLGLFMEQLAFCVGGVDEHERWRRALRTYRARLRGDMWERFCRRRGDPIVVERVRAVFHFRPTPAQAGSRS